MTPKIQNGQNFGGEFFGGKIFSSFSSQSAAEASGERTLYRCYNDGSKMWENVTKCDKSVRKAPYVTNEEIWEKMTNVIWKKWECENDAEYFSEYQRWQTEDCPQTCRQKTVGEAQTESGTEESGGQTRGTDIQVRGYGQSVWHLIRQTWASYLSNIPQLFPPLSSLSAARKLERGKQVWYVTYLRMS